MLHRFLLVGLAFSLTGQLWAGEPKVVGKDGVKFEGEASTDDPKVKIEYMGAMGQLPAKKYTVKLSAKKSYLIELKSVGDVHDPFLVVYGSAGNQLAADDDGGDLLNSKLVFVSPKDDTYTIYAATLKGEGKFELTLKEIGVAKITEVKLGESVKGTLNAANRQVFYQVKLAEGKQYTVEMFQDDSEIDPFLKLLSPDGKEVAKDDDSGGGLNARISYRAEKAGTYQIIATNFGGSNAEGAFRLIVREAKD